MVFNVFNIYFLHHPLQQCFNIHKNFYYAKYFFIFLFFFIIINMQNISKKTQQQCLVTECLSTTLDTLAFQLVKDHILSRKNFFTFFFPTHSHLASELHAWEYLHTPCSTWLRIFQFLTFLLLGTALQLPWSRRGFSSNR